jgi:hypothetical protein
MAKAGFQRKSQKWLQWFAVVFLFVATAGLLGGAIALAVSGLNGTAEDKEGSLWAGAFLLVLAGICAPFAYILLRKVVPRKAKHLSVTVDRPRARRGEEVVVRLDVLDPSDIAGQVDVCLRCTAFYEATTYVNGNRTSQTREHTAHDDRREVSGHGPQEFRFKLPADGPFSYEGTNFSMVWKVVARDAQPRRHDRTLEQPLEVLP